VGSITEISSALCCRRPSLAGGHARRDEAAANCTTALLWFPGSPADVLPFSNVEGGARSKRSLRPTSSPLGGADRAATGAIFKARTCSIRPAKPIPHHPLSQGSGRPPACPSRPRGRQSSSVSWRRAWAAYLWAPSKMKPSTAPALSPTQDWCAPRPEASVSRSRLGRAPPLFAVPAVAPPGPMPTSRPDAPHWAPTPHANLDCNPCQHSRSATHKRSRRSFLHPPQYAVLTANALTAPFMGTSVMKGTQRCGPDTACARSASRQVRLCTRK
jgi:hypothetical protein